MRILMMLIVFFTASNSYAKTTEKRQAFKSYRSDRVETYAAPATICRLRPQGQAAKLMVESWGEYNLSPGQCATLTCDGIARFRVCSNSEI